LGEYVRRQQNCDFVGIIPFLSQISAAFRPTRVAEVPVADDFVRVSSQTEMGKIHALFQVIISITTVPIEPVVIEPKNLNKEQQLSSNGPQDFVFDKQRTSASISFSFLRFSFTFVSNTCSISDSVLVILFSLSCFSASSCSSGLRPRDLLL
jgi:hypothetical protein